MKKKKYFILLLAALPLFFGCENKKQTEHIMSLQADSLRLTRLVEDKDVTINSLFQMLNEIEENLNTIREKESLIADQALEAPEMKAEVKERINQNISEINELMNKNQRLINRLNARVRSSNLNIAELNKAIERMQETIDNKEKEITELKLSIANLNIQVETLNTQVADLEKETEEKAKAIDEKISEINKAWFVVGDRRELRDKGVINRKGGFIFIGKVTTPAEDLIQKDFTEIDIREVTEIPLNVRRIEIVTVHPEGSYQIVGDNPIEKLVITKPQEFWKASNYLVISTR